MSSYKSADIRNIALVGHSGAGKTMLAEVLLEQSGAIHSRGSIARGTTVCDFDSQEKALGHSLETSLCSLEHAGAHINIIDTPGYPDFSGRAIAVLPAVETAALVINATNGVELQTQRMMEAATHDRLCRMIIVNRIDEPGLDLAGLMRKIREVFGSECLPINLPADGGKRVVDCYFKPETGETVDFSSVQEAHTEIVDQVVELDEALMESYLEQGEELESSQLHDVFEKAMRRGHLIPVCFTSAETGSGINQLLNILVKLMPNPMEGNPPPFMKGQGKNAVPVKVVPDRHEHAVAHVFKVMVDPFIGRMGVFRIHQGTIKTNSSLFIGDARKPFKVAHLYTLQGKDHSETARGVPGDICAVAKIDEIEFDAVLHDSHDEDNFHLEAASSPPPMHGVA
ncbi:MAG: GTP-binding protein, partial [Candidatus Binatia bacterium]